MSISSNPVARWRHRERQMGKMCSDCLLGRHACEIDLCPCVCNDADFPWPPREEKQPDADAERLQRSYGSGLNLSALPASDVGV